MSTMLGIAPHRAKEFFAAVLLLLEDDAAAVKQLRHQSALAQMADEA